MTYDLNVENQNLGANQIWGVARAMSPSDCSKSASPQALHNFQPEPATMKSEDHEITPEYVPEFDLLS